MDFNLTQDQEMLADSALSFAARSSPVTRFRKLREDPLGWDRALWKQMGELGWLGAAFPESVGGFGGTFLEAAIILEKLGTTLVPEPIIASVVLGGLSILHAGNDEQQKRWLAPLVQGDTSLALAYAERQSRHDLCDVETRAVKDGGVYRLRGEKVFVLNGHAADEIVVSARTGGAPRDRDGVSLFVVGSARRGLGVRPIKTMDGQRAAMLMFDDVAVEADRLLGPVDGARETLELAMDRGAAAACAEGLGICQAVLEMTVSYLNTREQFGVKIGSFQALQHRCVDMFVETELCRSTSILATLKVDDPDPEARMAAISAAKVQLAQGGKQVTAQSIQLHGGIGLTDEHDVGLYFKRMHVLNSLFGDEEHHVARYASLPAFTRDVAAGGLPQM